MPICCIFEGHPNSLLVTSYTVSFQKISIPLLQRFSSLIPSPLPNFFGKFLWKVSSFSWYCTFILQFCYLRSCSPLESSVTLLGLVHMFSGSTHYWVERDTFLPFTALKSPFEQKTNIILDIKTHKTNETFETCPALCPHQHTFTSSRKQGQVI